MLISDLPVELESEILCRIPATSLNELRPTCKRWYNLFKDPKFVKKHLSKAAREVKVMVLMNLRLHSIRVNLQGIRNDIDPSVEFNGQLMSLKDSKGIEISQIFHCDGLILCSTKGNESLVVWNPCTCETKWIEPRTCYKSNDVYALGFGNKSYKILKFFRDYDNQNVQVGESCEIYELSTDSWKVLDGVTHDGIIESRGETLKGNCYWVAGSAENGFFMLNFDFTRERFGNLPLPFQSNNPEDTAVLSVVREEKLAVIYQDILAFSNVMKIWVTNKIDEEAKEVITWSKFCVVDYDGFGLESVANVSSFFLDEENKVALCCDLNIYKGRKISIYVVGEEIHREVYEEKIEKRSQLNFPRLVSYVPSLVQIQEKTTQGKRKRSTKEGTEE